MGATIGRGVLIAMLAMAPGVARADDGGFWPSWLSAPWSGGLPEQQTSPRSPGAAQPATKDTEKLIKLPAAPEDLQCPEVDVSDGGATARVGGATSQEVRYQFNISDVARECNPQGSQFALRVGVSGHLLIGPAGSPGAYSTTLHVVVKREIDGKTMFDKSFSVAANTNGGTQGAYRVVTDPILLPLTRARLDEDYAITVGLGAGGGAVNHSRRARRRG